MNSDRLSSRDEQAAASSESRTLTRFGLFAAVAIAALIGAAAVWVGVRFSRSALVDLGPTDAHYVHDFREIERDGDLYFRWSSVPASSISVPVKVCGDGSVRLRVRRHFVDPATLTISLDGRIIGEALVQAGAETPYKVLEFPFKTETCNSTAGVLLQSVVGNDRPLGVAVDWVEIRSPAGFRSGLIGVFRGAALLGALAFVLVLAGGSRLQVWALIGLLGATVTLALSIDVVAAERILRGGLVSVVLTAALGFGLSRVLGWADLARPTSFALVVLTLVTLISRSGFLHTRAFYPDYRVHALVQQTYNNLGAGRFLNQLFEIQYARSLGLQEIGDRWYPFPYPPGFYALASRISTVFGLDALDAVTVFAIVASSLLPLLAFALGRQIRLSQKASLIGAAFVVLHPLMVRRMALGYFPSLVSQAVDAMALLIAIRMADSVSPRRLFAFAGVLTVGFLIYTQSIANFGLLAATLLALDIVRRAGRCSRATLAIAACSTIALLGSFGAFYYRYVPVAVNVANHRSQPESRVLDRLDDLRRNSAPNDPADAIDENDPYAGSTLNPVRGLGRLVSRLWRFNGVFTLLVVAGAWFLLRQRDAESRQFLLAWACVTFWVSLLAAGLPSPNGFQHLKDLEFTLPLAGLALGALVDRFPRYRATAIFGGVAWGLFALNAYALEFSARLLPVTGG